VHDDFLIVTVTDTNTPRGMPYEESFESYAVGQQLGGIHGWTGDAVVETNETPHGHAGPHPVLDATHAQALRLRGDAAIEFTGTEHHSNVWFDVLIERIPWSEDAPPALPPEAVQFALYVTSSNKLAVWNTQATGVWTVLPDVSLVTGQWVRLTVNMDYAAEPDRYRLWIDGTVVTNPLTWFVSGKTEANRLAGTRGIGGYRMDELVVDDYDLLNYRKVIAAATGKGEVVPAGEVLVPIGGDTNVTFTASNYFHVGQVAVDEVAMTTNGPVVSVALTNIVSRHSVKGVFDPNLTPTHSVPEWWLAAADAGWTNAFEFHAERDADGDGHLTWEEFVAGTHPTSIVDVFALEVTASNGVPVVTFEARAAGPDLGGSQRYYSLEMSADLGTGAWSAVPGYAAILGAGQTVVHTVHTNALATAAYRARVYVAPAFGP